MNINKYNKYNIIKDKKNKSYFNDKQITFVTQCKIDNKTIVIKEKQLYYNPLTDDGMSTILNWGNFHYNSNKVTTIFSNVNDLLTIWDKEKNIHTVKFNSFGNNSVTYNVFFILDEHKKLQSLSINMLFENIDF